MTLIRTGVPRIAARAYVGMWIIDCGHCPMAYRTQPGIPTAECWRCGTTTEIVWPSPEMVAGIERILLMRPDELNRNWWPGETLADLMGENVTHGIAALPVANLEPGAALFATAGDQIVLDALPQLNPRRELV